ncbi:phage portal protein [Aeromonas caviae]|uniref:phage portal protein n=1 Tax=Aeromonas caviae TaxID=648 RepID=UPI003EC8F29C
MLNKNLGQHFNKKSADSSPYVGNVGPFNISSFGDYQPNYLQEPTALACLKIICNTVSSLPIECKYEGKKYNEFSEKLPDGVSVLVRKPNDDETISQLSSKIAANLVCHSEAYLQIKMIGAKNGIGGRLRSIECIPTGNVTRTQDGNGKWKYGGVDNQNKRIISEEIVRLTGVSLDSRVVNILKNSKEIFNLSLNGIKSASENHKRGPKNAGFIQYEDKIKEDTYNRLDARVNSQGSDESRGNIVILDKGATFTPNPFNMKDTQLTESMELSVEQIAMLMGVPLQLLGGTGDSSFKDMNEIRQGFLSITINPIIKAIEDAIHNKLNYEYIIDYQEKDFLNSNYETRVRLGMEMFKLGLVSNIETRATADMESEGLEERFVIESNNNSFGQQEEQQREITNE